MATGNFPMLGVGEFYEDSKSEIDVKGFIKSSMLVDNPCMNSDFIPDKCFNSHPRFA